MTNDIIKDIFYVLLTVVLPLALRFAYQIVTAKVSGSRYADAVNAVFAGVISVNQTYVDALKAAGEFDTAAQRLALERAKSAALDLMETETIRWLEKAHTDLDAWLTVQIERAVKEMK